MTSTKDAERLADLLRRRADVYHPARRAPSYYGDDDIDLLRSIIDRLTQERDEARRSADDPTKDAPNADIARLPAFNQSDWLFVIGLRRAHIEVTHDGRLAIKFDESPGYAAKTLRDYIIKESDQ